MAALTLLFGVVNGAIGIGTYLVGRAFTFTIRDDGLGGEAAGLIFRSLRLLLVLGLLFANGNQSRSLSGRIGGGPL